LLHKFTSPRRMLGVNYRRGKQMTEKEKTVLWEFLGNKVHVVGLEINQTEKGLECDLKPVPVYRDAIFNHFIEREKHCTHKN